MLFEHFEVNFEGSIFSSMIIKLWTCTKNKNILRKKVILKFEFFFREKSFGDKIDTSSEKESVKFFFWNL